VRLFEIIDQVLNYNPEANVALLEKAYVFSAKVHRGQVRLSGEPYLSHPLAVAGILVRMRLDDESIAAGLLHDALEGQHVELEAIEKAFGKPIAHMVQGVTKLGGFDFASREERQAEYMRKMILAMSQDIRVLLIKLADRLHSMRTLQYHSPEKQLLVAQETLDIYAPLAGRLGIDWIRTELEDLAFSYLHPETHAEIDQNLAQTEEERNRYIEEVKQILTSKLHEYNLEGRVSGRSKHTYGIYRKMVKQNLDLQHIYDVIAFRIIVPSIKACYEALGMIHACWKPVPGRFKDYIGMPKSNMYQSLHTTVIGPYGERMEVQIRTEEMHKIANEGIAAHWLYKEGKGKGKIDQEETERLSWLRQLLEWQKELRDPKEFLEAVKVDLYPDEVYVFTPQGDVKAFPRGSTPIDFAYSIHSQVGHQCVGAKVNGKLVPLRFELRNGDRVEIVTASNHQPSKDWLKIVKTSRAQSRIRHWIKTEEREHSIALGREICEREFRKRGLNFHNYANSPELQEAAKGFSLRSIEDLLASVGYGKVSAVQVIGKLIPSPPEEPRKAEVPLQKRKRRKTEHGIRVKGVDDVMIRIAKCCNPLPGEAIMGYITRGRGVTVHRQSCTYLSKSDFERQVEVQWDTQSAEQVFPVDIEVVCANLKGMLATLSGLLSDLDINILDVSLDNQPGGQTICHFSIEVKNREHLRRALNAVKGAKNVYRARRLHSAPA
jgi:GTP diphosphokinase / guanosine-3',5'-bis(diphosphate) 3'-diphosphatase